MTESVLKIIQKAKDQNITKLYIMTNGLKKLPNELFELNHLEELSIGNSRSFERKKENPLILKEIPNDLFQLINLKSLTLTGLFIEKISDDLGNLVNLENLDVSHNKLKLLPKSISKLTKLNKLSIYSNQLSELEIDFAKLVDLKEIHLEYNQISTISETIGFCTKLPSIDFRHNNLKFLPNSIGNLLNLRSLVVSSNKLEKLPETIGNLTQLQYLDVTRNCLEALPEEISKLYSLIKISAGHNNLKSLPLNIGDLQQLETLTVHKNQLDTIPASLINLKSLKNFGRSNNPFTDMPELLGIKGFLDIFRYLSEYYGTDKKSFTVNLEKEWQIPIQQYLMFFREYIEKTEGKMVDYQVNIVQNGLEIIILNKDDMPSRDIASKILEYVNLLRTNLEDWMITDNTGHLTAFEADVLTEELKENKDAFWYKMTLQKTKLAGQIRRLEMNLREEKLNKVALKDELDYAQRKFEQLEFQLDNKNDKITFLEKQIEKIYLQVDRKDNLIDNLVGKMSNSLPLSTGSKKTNPIEELVAKHDLVGAIDLALDANNLSKSSKKTLIVLKSRLVNLQNGINNGILENKESNLGLSEIANSILNISEELEE